MPEQREVTTFRAEALAVLSPDERQAFDRVAGKVLAGLIRGPGATRWMCRLCDTGVCRGAAGGCPVGNAARERYLTSPGGAAASPTR